MSSTEDQPAIGSPEWARALPPDIHTRGDLAFSRTHVWTDDNGVTHALIGLGAVDLTFHSPRQVRDVIAYLAGLAGEMDAEITRQRARPLDVAAGADPLAIPANRIGAPDLGAPDAEDAYAYDACSRCGKTGAGALLVLRDGVLRCNESHRCAERVAARDAEAAQAGAR